MIVFTHRGLDPDRKEYYLESSKESFLNQIKRGYGLEFDIQQTSDNNFIVFHDGDLKRISKGKNFGKFKEMKVGELLKLEIDSCHLIDLSRMLKLIEIGKVTSALHFKHHLQTPPLLDLLINFLKKNDFKNIVVFDLKPDSALYLKSRVKNMNLAASVSHPYDIERYNKFVGDTLMTINDVLKYKDLYNWVWLDEWDVSDYGGKMKTLYNVEVVEKLKQEGFKICVVSPELHRASPGLLGGEFHPDADNRNVLTKRLKEIIKLSPDAICTDYPDLVSSII